MGLRYTRTRQELADAIRRVADKIESGEINTGLYELFKFDYWIDEDGEESLKAVPCCALGHVLQEAEVLQEAGQWDNPEVLTPRDAISFPLGLRPSDLPEGIIFQAERVADTNDTATNPRDIAAEMRKLADLIMEETW